MKYIVPKDWLQTQIIRRPNAPHHKCLTADLEDPDRANLTFAERGLLDDLRRLTARLGRPLPDDCAYLGRALHAYCRSLGSLLGGLKSKGFIELTDDNNLFFSPSRELEKREERQRKKETPNGVSKERPSPDFTPSFVEFWESYPRQRRGNKQKAWQAWRRAVSDRASEGEIVQAVRSYAASAEVAQGYAKGAEAWLNDDRWRVDYSVVPKPGNGPIDHGTRSGLSPQLERMIEDGD